MTARDFASGCKFVEKIREEREETKAGCQTDTKTEHPPIYTPIGNNIAWERNPTLCHTPPFVIPSEAEGSAVRLHPKRRPYK